MNPRILVTVSRSWKEWSKIREVLEKVHGRYPDAVLVHGNAPRGDRQAAGIWKSLGGVEDPWPADWERLGKRAGIVRNIAMVESGAQLCLAFIRNESKGATHCADLAEGTGIPTVRYEDES